MIEHSHQILYTICDAFGATWSGIDSVSKRQGHTAQKCPSAYSVITALNMDIH